MARRLRLRRRPLADQLYETLILRDDEVIAVLPPGDPFLYALQLSGEELRDIQSRLGRALEARPWERQVLEAIIEYKLQGQDSK